jgi:SMI1 / KNR4 family (SUKH-1)
MMEIIPQPDWPSIVKPTGLPIDTQQVQSFESELGYKLPEDFRDFLLNFNGGVVVVDHDIYSPALSCDLGVNSFLPLTEASPFLGIREARDIQVKNKFGPREALMIANDGGTGFFYMILDGEERGAVYFSWKDDVPDREGEWFYNSVVIPDSMVKVSSSFSELGQQILDNRSEP